MVVICGKEQMLPDVHKYGYVCQIVVTLYILLLG